MNLESIYAKSEELTDGLNNWLLNEGGNEIVHASAQYAIWALAIICFVGLWFERRNSRTQALVNERSTFYMFLCATNFGLGSFASFLFFASGSFWTGLLLLATIYIVPIHRSFFGKMAAMMLNQVPGVFYDYTNEEKRIREKTMSKWFHEKLLCDYPEMIE